MSSTVLSRKTAPHVIRFFDACFRQGVLDACDFGNDLDAKEFLEQKTEDWTFGMLGQPDDMDWKAFCYQMYWLARKNGMNIMAESYFFRIRNKNYTWCILPYCMRFYLMGVREWLAYPNPGRIEIFKASKKAHWDPNQPIKSITKPDIISYLHEFEVDYSRLDADLKPISENSMSTFVKALFDLSRKLIIKEKYGEDDL